MKRLAVLYRGLQLYAHNAHNLAKGKTFFEDHEYLGELYGAYESAYDSIVERMIGLDQKIDLKAITTEAADMAGTSDISDNDQAFRTILATEKELQTALEEEDKSATFGTCNLLQDLADQSEARMYKLKRRLKA